MRKIASGILCLILIGISLCACNNNDKSNNNKIIATYMDIGGGGDGNVAIITDENELYMWGDNRSGQIGNGTTKENNKLNKIMSNIKFVDISTGCDGNDSTHVAAITENGDLYMWGDNTWGQVGNGKTSEKKGDVLKPVKVMENVKSVSLGGNTSAAITKDEALYMWGYNNNRELGVETEEHCTFGNISSKPTKVMENVKSVSLGGYGQSAVITKDDCLYTWGNNDYGQLGNGDINHSSEKMLILDNVETINMGGGASGSAITKEGDLYVWGDNSRHQLGIETSEIAGYDNRSVSTTPVKIMENIVCSSIEGSHSAVITEDGELYTWGDNDSGLLGNGTTTDSDTPIKVRDNVESVNANGLCTLIKDTNGDFYMCGLDSHIPFVENEGSTNIYGDNIHSEFVKLNINGKKQKRESKESKSNKSEKQMQENESNYSWILQPTIIADEIIVPDESISPDNRTNARGEAIAKRSEYAIIERNGKYGFIDDKGNELCKICYDTYEVCQCGAVDLQKLDGDGIATEIAYINEKGQIAISKYGCQHGCIPEYALYSPFERKIQSMEDSSSYTGVVSNTFEEYNQVFAFANKGSVVTEFIFDDIVSQIVEPDKARCFAGEKDDVWGYYLLNGKEFLSPQFEGLSNNKFKVYLPTEGYIAVKKDNKCGYYNIVGDEVIPCGEFEAVCPVYEGKAWVKYEGKWGIINMKKTYE